ncbi:MAG: trafficking protein particle complex II-specific subunit 120 [candidate division Zixibacteria bacterium]|nr:trafficking protein particle complex II-specific subunit 120 [candidate division Zixibacteria bacterium]MDH3939050.1 trafficking protein particle complex II-specific subunit 120 [candidate division Zixibacteria bacterium]MDH4035395.1 trafficking protein particle complex II-specific subunit 120 [candidate division Zixibacteria bacterium]
MAIIKGSQLKSDQPTDGTPEQSIYVSNSKIDKEGEAWTRQAVWLRQEHLNKLKVIAHFQNKTIEQLLDGALGDFVNRIWDNTMAREKLVGDGTGKVKTPNEPGQ